MNKYIQQLKDLGECSVYTHPTTGEEGILIDAQVRMLLMPPSISTEYLVRKKTDWTLFEATDAFVPMDCGSFKKMKELASALTKKTIGEYDNLRLMQKAANHIRDELSDEELMLTAAYRRQLEELHRAKHTRTQHLMKAIDSKMSTGSKFIVAFDGYPESKPYQSFKEARRAHSKRNIYHVECQILQDVNGKRGVVCEWDTYSKTWIFANA